MKNIFLGIAIFSISAHAFSQTLPKLILTQQGFEPIVVQIVQMKAADLYKCSINWVQLTYQNPKEVLKANIENEYIRLEGFKKGAFYRFLKSDDKDKQLLNEKAKQLKLPNLQNVSPTDKVYYDLSYSLEVGFKDGRYRFTFTPKQITINASNVYFGISDFFSGQPDTNGNSYDGCVTSLEESTNALSQSLYNYLIGKKENGKW